MEKLFIKNLFYIAAISLSIIVGNYAYATKMARTQLIDLLNSAHVVGIVMIEAAWLTDKTQPQIHTTTPLLIVEHKARVLNFIKGKTDDKSISFLSTKGLSPGKKYVVFLEKDKNNLFRTMLNDNGAFRISYISNKQGVVEATRISESYIKIPDSISQIIGVSTKDEQSSYVWVENEQFINYLHKENNSQ